MLLNTFYQHMTAGGGVVATNTSSEYDIHYRTMANTTSKSAALSNQVYNSPRGMNCTHSYSNVSTGQYSDSSSGAGACQLVFGYDSERTELTVDMYTVRGSKITPASSSSSNSSTFSLFETINNKRVKTGVKYVYRFTNSTSSDITINQVGIAMNTSNRYSYEIPSSNSLSDLVLLAIKYLDEDVTIAPQETYTFEYELKNLCPINEDLY